MNSDERPHVLHVDIPESVWLTLRTLEHGMRKPILEKLLLDFCEMCKEKQYRYLAIALILNGTLGIGYNNSTTETNILYGKEKEL